MLPIAQGAHRPPQNVGQWERMACVAAGSILVVSALRRRPLAGAAQLAAGGALLYRGASGHCPAYTALGVSSAKDGAAAFVTETHRSITIDASPEALYQAWRDPGTLARIIEPQGSLRAEGERWHWTLHRLPGNGRVEWDTEISDDQPPRSLAWRSVPSGAIACDGSIKFGRQQPGWGTEVTLTIKIGRPPSLLSAALLKAVPALSKAAVGRMLRRFKSLVETGEMPTTNSQPAARHDGHDQ